MSFSIFTPEDRVRARDALLAVVRADDHEVRREWRSPDGSRVTLYMPYAHVSTEFSGRHLVLKVRLTTAVGALYGLKNIESYWHREDGGVCNLKRSVFPFSLGSRCECLANILDFARANDGSM